MQIRFVAAILALPLGLSLAACDASHDDASVAGEGGSAMAETPGPTPTVTETVTREPDPQVEAAGAGDEAQADSGSAVDTIPARFHGNWVENREECGFRGHQVYDIRASEVGFFESTGVVQDVRVNGAYAAATLSEQYGDAPPAVYAFYMAIEGPDTLRIRYDDNPRIRVYRCPQ